MDEALRIARLHDLRLDQIKQPVVFEWITQFASEALACPIAVITVIDEGREWFLARTGLAFESFEREHSFCSACLALGKPLLVENALEDPRFRLNALAQGTSGQRSYVGIPLRMEDTTPVGTLWCASPQIAAFGQGDIERLSTLAELTEQCLNAHAKTMQLAQANASILQLNQVFKQAETAAHIGSWRVDIATNELHWSDQVFAIHGVPVGTQINVEVAIQYYTAEDQPKVAETIARVLEDGQPFSFEATIKRADGQLRRIRSMGERIDVNGEPSSLTGVFIDCTEEHLQTIALQRAATRDPLTGLYNRSEFDRRLVEALSDRNRRGSGCPLTVMLVDLDGFKDVNDRLGHLVGDRLLVQLAQQLDRTVQGGSFLARWGGDEFAMLFPPGCPIEEARRGAERLITELSKQIQIADNVIHISATCGLAEMRDDAAAEELMRRADLALYHGKANGRGSAHCWSAGIEATQAARQAAIAQLSDALDTGRAFAAYQPIYEIGGERVFGVEALLRLRDTAGRVISASEFFPALVDPFLARRVSRFMLDQVIKEAPGLLALYGPDMRIGINVSEADLSQDDFLNVVEDLVAHSVLKPTNITLEVTETMLLLDESGRICDLLTALDQRGFTVALDDFGTGFSSLTHLRDFPIRKVKIDKEFISDLSHDHQSRLIVQAMVQMAQSLNIGVVAEGVETEDQRAYLQTIGCSHAQGFKFARPRSLADLQAERALSKGRPPSNRSAA